MDADDYWREVGELRAFRNAVNVLTLQSVALSLPAISVAREDPVEWSAALLAASLVERGAPESLLDGALRIAQGCVQATDSTLLQREAGRILLQRLGNSRSVELAIQRGLLAPNAPVYSTWAEIDAFRTHMELTVPLASGEVLHANDFQARFWRAAETSQWVSATAPTSAGKSFIVKQWLRDRSTNQAVFTCVYIVPTRALIEEVAADLREEGANLFDVFELPWDERIKQSQRRVLVLTQERLHVLQQENADLRPDLIFVDEAQKIGDGRRGVLLQRVLDDATRRNPDAQVMFASPMAANPELLVENAIGTVSVISDSAPTVNQNVIYAQQVRGKPREWIASVMAGGESREVGGFTISARPVPDSKRLPLVAAALGSSSSANIVYANGQADAEKIASQLFDLLPAQTALHEDIEAVRELVERTVHPKYSLRTYLERGIAFHYGNMPLLLREAIESLFKTGRIQFLVCTSTLLEGVNLPCQNIFVRAPRKGRGRPMPPSDFWNLAGRAGRWGKEFQGNVICVDAEDWEHPPIRRDRQKIVRATDAVRRDLPQFLRFINGDELEIPADQHAVFESTLSLLASRTSDANSFPWLSLDPDQQNELAERMRKALGDITVPSQLVQRHAGIDPRGMNRLLKFFEASGVGDAYAIPQPEAAESAGKIATALSLVDQHLGGTFGAHTGRHMQLAILLVYWMRGRPLPVLIDERVRWERSNKPNFSLPRTIRDVMSDVEQYARFEAPLFLSCFMDLLQASGTTTDLELPDIAMMLELGVSRGTEVSALAIGISRTSAVALAEHIAADDLSPAQLAEWLHTRDLDEIDLPELVRSDVRRALGGFVA
ncbi:DEAD/DEAH box helicase [Agromyces sp. SYSU K20354]|uniref:DEAD/DEAH box helicase n=1 Tax=Agromyces cavernae TaxID=2898659 RepID=UPI001E3B6BA9|nr:DEAD/DEAH box helicase [Agromyces cavernae]MCD2443069.1 DEAD/DEAH box helicase [Agromyces cavernae]